MKNPFDYPPDPLPVQEGGKDYIWGDTGRIWFRILLTSFCKNDAQTPLPKEASAPLGRGSAPKKGRSPSGLPLFHHPVRLVPGYVFAPWIPACAGMTSTSIIRKDIYETLH